MSLIILIIPGTATLAFDYKPAVISSDGENLGTPAGAVTRNKQ